MIRIKRLHNDAKPPRLGSENAAGLDIHTIESVTIKAGKRALLKTGFAMALPKGFHALIWPRSKLAAKMGLDVLAGVVDNDYRGEIMVSLLNTGEDDVEIQKGDRVAQMIVQTSYSNMLLVDVDHLDDTVRGNAGVNDAEMRLR